MTLRRNEVNIIMRIFRDHPDIAISGIFLIRYLRRANLDRRPQRIIIDAIDYGLLYIDRIQLTNSGLQNMVLALDVWGTEVWEELYGNQL